MEPGPFCTLPIVDMTDEELLNTAMNTLISEMDINQDLLNKFFDMPIAAYENLIWRESR